MFIGGTIYTFNTPNKELIRQYYSPIEEDAIPGPFATSKNYTYIMWENIAIPNKMLKKEPIKLRPCNRQSPLTKKQIARLPSDPLGQYLDNPKGLQAKKLKWKVLSRRVGVCGRIDPYYMKYD